MAQNSPATATFHLDPDHTGLRLVVLLSLFVSGGLAFAAIREMLRLGNGRFPDYTFLVSCAGAIPVALVSIWLIEMVLKRIWHSGRRIEIDENGLTYANKAETKLFLPWNDEVETTHWLFGLSGFTRVGQERQIPKNWVCLASELTNDAESLIVFTYMSRRESRSLMEAHDALAFGEIDPRLVYETSLQSKFEPPKRPELTDEVLEGENGRYWIAEERRWRNGHELSRTDYKLFAKILSQYIADA